MSIRRVFAPRIGLLGPLVALSCTTLLGIDEDYRLAPAETGGTDSGTDAIATGGSAGAAGVSCDEYAAAICGFRSLCCSALWSITDISGCIDAMRAGCLTASETDAGSLNVQYWDLCKKNLAEPQQPCVLDVEQLGEMTLEVLPCTKILTGNRKLGESCNAPWECELIPAPGLGAICQAGVCTLLGQLSLGASCDLAQPAWCAPGSYCKVAEGGTLGTCSQATALGAPCAKDVECGRGRTCDGSCKVGLPNGNPCTENHDCASFLCNGNVCTPRLAVTKPECSGSS